MQDVSSVSATSTTSTSTVTNASTAMGKDDFLKLLLAQIKNQDPLSPMDATDFTGQLAQYSSIEQLMNINSSLKSSAEASQTLTENVYNTLATNLIGKQVKADTNDLKFDGTNGVSFGFTYPETAATFKVTIKDADGAVVKTFNQSYSSGENTITWDGKDNNGNTVAADTYTISISATDSNGDVVGVNPFTLGTITAIRYKSGEAYFVVNGMEINVKNLEEIVGGTNG
jgi:flagellar basal-body rod modification protein FlgD